MNKWKSLFLGIVLFTAVTGLAPKAARADFWGGDVIVLSQILSNAIQQLSALNRIIGTGRDTIDFLRQINDGLNQAMSIMRTANATLRPGVLSDYRNVPELLGVLQSIYGAVPATPESRMQELHDQSVAESITLHNEAFIYADGVDNEAERIKSYSGSTSPLGAARLTAESLGVLINVNDQILRTHAASLKIASESLAMNNRREKVNSDHFVMQYEGLSSALKSTTPFKTVSDLSGHQ